MDKPRILIVIPPYNGKIGKNCNYIFPLGIPYVAGALRDSGFHYDTLNLNHQGESLEELLGGKEYDFFLTGGNSLLFNLLEDFISSARKTLPPSCKIILGGPIVTSDPDLACRSLDFDYAVIGEAELTIVTLLKTLSANGDPAGVSGICFRKRDTGECVITGPGEFVSDLNKVPLPDLDSFGYEYYLEYVPRNFSYFTCFLEHPRPYVLMGSRGCPFRCTFCYHDQKYRERSMDSIFAELIPAVKKYRINLLCLNDDCFSIKKARLEEFCRRMTALQQEIDWELQWTVQLMVSSAMEETLQLLKSSGCNSVSYGFESFDADVLKSMNKPIKPEDIDHALKLTVAAGIKVQGNFIFGDVAETEASYRRTLEYWKKNCIGHVNVDLIALYPGSKIYLDSVRRGVISDKLDFIKNYLNRKEINFTTGMSARQYRTMVRRIIRARVFYNRHVVLPADTRPGRKCRFHCPHCRKLIESANLVGVKYSNTNFICPECSRLFYIYWGWLTGLRMYAILLKGYIMNFADNLRSR